MTLTELIAEVYVITNRPDLTAETLSAVRSGTMKCHRADFFVKDIFETGITFPTATFLQAIQYRDILPRWRAFKYLRKFDPTAFPSPGLAGEFFEFATPGTSLDSYSINRENICYLAGDNIQVRSSTEIQYALLGCYLNPQAGITDGTFASWIAEEFPWAIIHQAASSVFRMIGKLDESNAQMALWQLEMNEVTSSNITNEGF